MRCGSVQGRASEEILPLRRRSAAVDFWPARFRRLEVSCETEKALKCVYMPNHQNGLCQMVNRWGILAASSAFCRSGGAQMEAMRDTAWVLTHALVNATNACLSSSFLRTVRGFGSRFGPIAKWPFSNETSFRKDPHFEHVAKTLRKSQSFLNFHFVKNGSYPSRLQPPVSYFKR